MESDTEEDISVFSDDLEWKTERRKNKRKKCKDTRLKIKDKELVCIICMEVGPEHILTACGHHFCVSCFEIWYESKDGSKKCPICRQHISLEEIHFNGKAHKFNLKRNSSFAKYTKPVRIVEPGVQNINQIRIGSSSFHSNDVNQLSFVAAFSVYALLGILLYVLYNRYN